VLILCAATGIFAGVLNLYRKAAARFSSRRKAPKIGSAFNLKKIMIPNDPVRVNCVADNGTPAFLSDG
jgi:hypothetical protein